MTENSDSYASSGDNDQSISSAEDPHYSTDDGGSGSSNDDNSDISSDDDSSTQDVLIDDLIDDQEEFATSSRRKSLIFGALIMLLACLLLNFSYVLVQLHNISENSDASLPEMNNNLMKRSNLNNSSNISNKNEILNNIQSSGYNEPKQNKLVREKTGIYKFTGLHGNKYRGGGVLSDAMIEQYEEDGVIVIRNLIPSKLLEKLDDASATLVKEHQEKEGGKKTKRQQFHMVKNGAIFLGVPSADKQSCSSSSSEDQVCISDAENDDARANNDETMSAFRHLAMYTKIPRVAASLLRLDELRVGGAEYLNLPRRLPGDPEPNQIIDDNINLRVCRDIFLTKDEDEFACGWHVDDTGFWPSIASDPGVNAWVALDDMPYQWSRKKLPKHLATDDEQQLTNRTAVATFALSLGSHQKPWREEAYEVTGSTHTLPPEGFLSAADMIKRRSGKGTCNIKTSAPHLYEKLEENKIVYDIKKGDVIFHDRWLFHRTVTVAEYENQLKRDSGEITKLERSGKIFRRYSIRYSPGSARVPPGYGVEPSVLYNAANANRTLDEIVESDGPWYPKAWPHLKENDEIDDIEGLATLVHEKMPQAEKARDERKKEIRMALKKGGGP